MQRVKVLSLVLVFVLAASFLRAAESIAELRVKAEKGDAAAQYKLGVEYNVGIAVKRDPVEALRWWRKAAEQGNRSAQYDLGGVYRGFFQSSFPEVATDYDEALKWNRKAAALGHTSAHASIGRMYYDGHGVTKDEKEAISWWRKAAQLGHQPSQRELGERYSSGDGVPKNEDEAMKWFRMAAMQEDDYARYRLGLIYLQPETKGRDKNPIQAVHWFRQAAERGDADAQFALAVMYDSGEGVLKDEIEALAWYSVSAISGHERAVKNRDISERLVGKQGTVAARQRSKEILAQIEAKRIEWALKLSRTPVDPAVR